MLLRIILNNFLSFRESTQFDMFPNPRRTSEAEHVYTRSGISFLKQAAVYGPNGAGKSNLIEGIMFLKSFVTEKDFFNREVYERCRFRLDPDSGRKPTELMVEFIASDGQPYIYFISLDVDGVAEESLMASGLGKTDDILIFRRRRDALDLRGNVSEEVGEIISRLLRLNPYSSFVALNHDLPVVNDPAIGELFGWFDTSVLTISPSSTLPTLIEWIVKERELKEFIGDMLPRLCLGIEGMDVEIQPAEEWIRSHTAELPESTLDNLNDGEFISRMKNERVSLAVFAENGVKKIGRLLFSQLGPEGYAGQMDIESQSDGTVRLLTLLPALYNAVKGGKTVIVDEIDYRMHPKLSVGIVEYFANNRETNGQLIFTTHETALMEKRHLLRNDEIWFADKREGVTRLYSLNDYRLHHTMSVRNGYMDGRFGAIPRIQ